MHREPGLPTVEQLEAGIVRLRPRERQVFDLAAREHLSNEAIARRLRLPVREVERLLARALCKLDRALPRR